MIGQEVLNKKQTKSDIILLCNAANSHLLPLVKIFGYSTIVNVDGIERKRAKWNSFGKLWYLLGEVCSVMFADLVVSDAEVIRDYYLKTYRQDSAVIPYGFRDGFTDRVLNKISSDLEFSTDEYAFFKSHKIEPAKYILYVSRLEPENHADVVIDAYSKLPHTLRNKIPLLIVGDAPYADEYKSLLLSKSVGIDGIRFLGSQYGKAYELLQLGATVYIQATAVGGTHPALVEAMGFGNAVVVNGTPENIEVVGDTGLVYERNSPVSLHSILLRLFQEPEKLNVLREKAFKRAQAEYHWNKVTELYQGLFLALYYEKNPEIQDEKTEINNEISPS